MERINPLSEVMAEHNLNYYQIHNKSSTHQERLTSSIAPDYGKAVSRMIGEQYDRLIELKSLKTNDNLKVLEVGPAEGLLALNILRNLRKERPEVYKKIEFHLADFSIHSTLKKNLEEFEQDGKIKIWQHNITDKLPVKGFHFVIANEVLDDLPATQATLLNGLVHSYHVEEKRKSQFGENKSFSLVFRPSPSTELSKINSYVIRHGLKLEEKSWPIIYFGVEKALKNFSSAMAPHGALFLMDYMNDSSHRKGIWEELGERGPSVNYTAPLDLTSVKSIALKNGFNHLWQGRLSDVLSKHDVHSLSADKEIRDFEGPILGLPYYAMLFSKPGKK